MDAFASLEPSVVEALETSAPWLLDPNGPSPTSQRNVGSPKTQGIQAASLQLPTGSPTRASAGVGVMEPSRWSFPRAFPTEPVIADSARSNQASIGYVDANSPSRRMAPPALASPVGSFSSVTAAVPGSISYSSPKRSVQVVPGPPRSYVDTNSPTRSIASPAPPISYAVDPTSPSRSIAAPATTSHVLSSSPTRNDAAVPDVTAVTRRVAATVPDVTVVTSSAVAKSPPRKVAAAVPDFTVVTRKVAAAVPDVTVVTRPTAASSDEPTRPAAASAEPTRQAEATNPARRKPSEKAAPKKTQESGPPRRPGEKSAARKMQEASELARTPEKMATSKPSSPSRSLHRDQTSQTDLRKENQMSQTYLKQENQMSQTDLQKKEDQMSQTTRSTRPAPMQADGHGNHDSPRRTADAKGRPGSPASPKSARSDDKSPGRPFRCNEGGSHPAGLQSRLSCSAKDVVNTRSRFGLGNGKKAPKVSCFEAMFQQRDPVQTVDVLLVGGGIMSATLALLLKQLQPAWKIVIVERLPEVAQESSNAWNNAGTGHAALCEPNYTPEVGNRVDIHKAVTVNENFQLSRQYWAYLAERGLVPEPRKFITHTPHMTFARGEEQISWLRKRFDVLKEHPLFEGMEYSEDHETMHEWAPLMMEGRDPLDRCAFTRVPYGTDVDFGELTKELTKAFISLGGDVQLLTEVCDFKRDESGLYDETWVVTTRKAKALGRPVKYRANFVFIGAGGYALPLLQKAGIPQIKGFMGFPISGEFLVCQNPEVVAKHQSKVYGKAAIGAPPMSVPHLDARVIGGKPLLLFGPFAGFSPRFLKSGSMMDLFRSIRLSNILPAAAAGLRNLDLSLYLLRQLLTTKSQKLAELREFMPEAEEGDWSLVTAGQRVQIMKADPEKTGVLQFGTEVVAAEDGSMAGLLGASPGASTAVQVALDVLACCFPKHIERWSAPLQEMIPSFGARLSERPDLARTLRESTAEALQL
ncbi:unnamed protein product [Effrenium voratum]|uniref:Malate dehydrogenase (quinone) n=1 Tax=Effrenium voratum TaxID=2562239 RepID=A0AA36JRB7_9DINO|nr:unnamed protein product [Effrenium voratum]